jgi:hypothetical protein
LALTKDQKKDMLLRSFEILKEDLSDNILKIDEIIGKMAKLDLDTAINMWEFVLEKGKDLVHDSEKAFSFCGGIIYELNQAIGEAAVNEIIRNNPKIRKTIYGESGDICISTYLTVIKFMELNDLETVNEIIDLIYQNPYKKQLFGEVLEEICESVSRKREITAEVIEMLVYWTEKISDEKQKARILVSLIDHM